MRNKTKMMFMAIVMLSQMTQRFSGQEYNNSDLHRNKLTLKELLSSLELQRG